MSIVIRSIIERCDSNTVFSISRGSSFFTLLCILSKIETFDHCEIHCCILISHQILNVDQSHKRKNGSFVQLFCIFEHILIPSTHNQFLRDAYRLFIICLLQKLGDWLHVIFSQLGCHLVFNASIVPLKHGYLEEIDRAHVFLTVLEMRCIEINAWLFGVVFFLIEDWEYFDDGFVSWVVFFDFEGSNHITLVEYYLFNFNFILIFWISFSVLIRGYLRSLLLQSLFSCICDGRSQLVLLHALNLNRVQESQPRRLQQRAEDIISDYLHILKLFVSCSLQIWYAKWISIFTALIDEVLIFESEVFISHQLYSLEFMNAVDTILINRYELLWSRGHAIHAILSACRAKV